MTDFRDLKAIAEACQRHQPLRFMRSHGALYIRNDNGIVFDVHQNRSFPELMAQNKDYADLALAANPAKVLALIEENERIKARLCVCRDCDGRGEIYSGHSSYQGHNQPPEPDMDVCGTCGGDCVLGPLEDFESLAAERDQLKAENELARMRIKELDLLFGRYILAMRSALIEEEHGKGPAAAMEWICNSLAGPGELPPEGETDSQAYFDREIVAVDDGMQEVMAFHEGRRAAMGKGEQS